MIVLVFHTVGERVSGNGEHRGSFLRNGQGTTNIILVKIIRTIIFLRFYSFQFIIIMMNDHIIKFKDEYKLKTWNSN